MPSPSGSDAVSHQLQERVKELRTLRSVLSSLVPELASSPAGLRAALRERLEIVVKHIPQGWQFPDATVAWIRFDEVEVWAGPPSGDPSEAGRPHLLPPGRPSLTAPIHLANKERGEIGVALLDPPAASASGEDPFLPEERDLLASLADAVGSFLAREDGRLGVERTTETLRAILNAAPLPIVQLDADGRVRDWNPRAASVLGLALDLAGGETLPLMLPEEGDGMEATRRLLEGISEGEGAHELRLLRADKTVGDFLAHTARARVPGEECAHFVLLLDDVTDKRERESDRERLRRAISEAGESVLVADEEGLVVYVNPAWSRETGYPFSAVKGGKMHDVRLKQLGDDESTREVSGIIDEVVEAGRTWRGRVRLRRADGTEYTKSLTFSPVRDEMGRNQGYVSIGRDVSREEELEARLEVARRVQAAGQLAVGVAHDLNNLLQVVSGHVSVLKEGGVDPSIAGADLQEIERAVGRGAALTRHLLSFGRSREPRVRVVDLRLLIGEMHLMLSQALGPEVELVVEMGEAPLPVRADPQDLEQVLLNLTLNARDAMGGVGRFALSVELPPGSDFTEVRVQDNGPGIQPEHRERIFEPFFTTKGVGHGTGLGLSTSRQILQAMGGDIVLEEEESDGAVFRVRLPRARPEELGPAGPQLSRKEGDSRGHERILVAEDEDAVRGVLCRVLRSRGYEVAEAEAVEEVQKLLREEARPDLLLLDIILPGGGAGTILKMMEGASPAPLPVVLMTGLSREEAVRAHGISAKLPLLEKPFVLEELLSRIRTTLDDRASGR